VACNAALPAEHDASFDGLLTVTFGNDTSALHNRCTFRENRIQHLDGNGFLFSPGYFDCRKREIWEMKIDRPGTPHEPVEDVNPSRPKDQGGLLRVKSFSGEHFGPGLPQNAKPVASPPLVSRRRATLPGDRPRPAPEKIIRRDGWSVDAPTPIPPQPLPIKSPSSEHASRSIDFSDIRDKGNLRERGSASRLIEASNRICVTEGVGQPLSPEEAKELYVLLRKWVSPLKVSQAHVLMAESYMQRLPKQLWQELPREELLAGCLMLADKYGNDRSYSVRSWGKVTEIPAARLVEIELKIFTHLGFDASVGEVRPWPIKPVGLNTVLHFAAQTEDYKALQLLLNGSAKALVNTPNEEGLKPLHVAVLQSGSPQVIALLIQAGADPHATFAGINALHMLAKRSDSTPEMIDILVKYGIEIDQKAEPGDLEVYEGSETSQYYEKNPLQLAVQEGNEEVAQKLVQLGANPTVRDANQSTLLHLHLANHSGDEEFIKKLIDFGVDPKASDNKGNTALHLYLASHWQEIEVITLLLENGVDVHARNDENDTVLHIATRSTRSGIDIEVVDALLEKGADVHQRSGKNLNVLLEALTAIAALDRYDSPEDEIRKKAPIMKRFIEKDVAIDEVDDSGRTALHLALELGVKELVPVLLEKNANILLCNKHGMTAADMAARKKQEILNSPWRNMPVDSDSDDDTNIAFDSDVAMEDSVIAAGEAQLGLLKGNTLSFSAKSKVLEQMISSLEKADPQNAHIEPPEGVALSPGDSDDEDQWSGARADRAQERVVQETRLANLNAFGRNVLAAQALHQMVYRDVPVEHTNAARLQNLIARIPPSMRPDATTESPQRS
jgi:ankyrin repeat protein